MNHSKLWCYRKLVEAAGEIRQLTRTFPKGVGFLTDQMLRASSSSALNLAEGNGRTKPKERRHFFDISEASASETLSCLDICAAWGLVHPAREQHIRSLLIEGACGVRRMR